MTQRQPTSTSIDSRHVSGVRAGVALGDVLRADLDSVRLGLRGQIREVHRRRAHDTSHATSPHVANAAATPHWQCANRSSSSSPRQESFYADHDRQKPAIVIGRAIQYPMNAAGPAGPGAASARLRGDLADMSARFHQCMGIRARASGKTACTTGRMRPDSHQRPHDRAQSRGDRSFEINRARTQRRAADRKRRRSTHPCRRRPAHRRAAR